MGFERRSRARGAIITIREGVFAASQPDAGQFGVQDVSGITEGAYKDNNSKITVITKDGALDVPAATFDNLTDTPANKTGDSLKLVRVNVGETALEYVSAGSDFLTQYALLAGRAGGQVQVGGTGAADTYTIRATSNATPGAVICEVEPGVEAWRTLATKELLVGRATLLSASDVLEVGRDQNANTGIGVVNETDGTSALSSVQARARITAGGTFGGALQAISEGFTPVAGVLARSVEITADSGATGGINIRHGGAFPVICTINGSEVWRTLSTGEFLVGRTAVLSAGEVANFEKNQNGGTFVLIRNTTDGTMARAGIDFRAEAGGGQRVAQIFITPSGNTEGGSVVAGSFNVVAFNVDNGLNIGTADATPTIFIANAIEEMRLTSGGGLDLENKDMTYKGSLDSVAVADEVSIGGYDIGAGNRVLAISQETVVAADADETKFSNKMQVRINGVSYFIMLTTT